MPVSAAGCFFVRLRGSPGAVRAGSSWLWRMHVARLFGVESCGLRIDLFSIAWFCVSLFAAVNPWCVSGFFCVCSQLFVTRCCSTGARLVDWRKRPFVAARTGDRQTTTRFTACPFFPNTVSLGVLQVVKRVHSVSTGGTARAGKILAFAGNSFASKLLAGPIPFFHVLIFS